MEGYVRIFGLQRCAQYNNSVGRIFGAAPSSAERVVVALQNAHTISVKAENLVALYMLGASQAVRNWFEEAIAGREPAPLLHQEQRRDQVLPQGGRRRALDPRRLVRGRQAGARGRSST